MRFFARIEVEPDDLAEDDEYPAVHRIVTSDVDVALAVKDAISDALVKHGVEWEATVTIEPLTPVEEDV